MTDLNAKIIPLHSEIEGRVPTDAQLDVAELSYNIADRTIFTKDSDGNIVILGAGAGLPGGDFDLNQDENDDDIALANGDILRFDGSNWRPRQYKIEELDDVAGTPEDKHVIQHDGTSWQIQIFSFDIEDAGDFELRADVNGDPILKSTGDALVWNGTKWVPSPVAALQSISALSDVNTVTNAPTNGQALIWDAAQNYWKPGSVAGVSSIDLDDLTDVSVSNPITNQLLKYTSGSWVNAALVYTDISDAPTVPSSIGDLSDVDLSLVANIGQVLTWDGSAWKPANNTGSGNSSDTVGGALTERADVSKSYSYSSGQSRNFSFSGLGEAGKFVQVASTQPVWIRFYATAADRTADASRGIDTDPLPGSGVLLEVRTDTPGQIVKITPGAIYYNNDTLPDQKLYVRATSMMDQTAVIAISIRAYTSTSTDAIDGGTFGSG